jgi:DNA-entry nuclease
MKKNRNIVLTFISILVLASLIGCSNDTYIDTYKQYIELTDNENVQQNSLDKYIRKNLNVTSDNGLYYIINDNQPFITLDDNSHNTFETYSELDELGRCGAAYANICKELMPTEERGEIGHIKPSGWHTIKYDCVDGKYLYNRCHLIGFQLAGENDNKLNLITGTRAFNVDGMLPFENMIADYVKETDNHVLYRVTPIFEEDNLIAYGVLMEALSVEDNGEGIKFNIFAKNIQDGIEINYITGESCSIDEELSNNEDKKTYTENTDGIIYILNIESKKYHLESCRYVESMSEENRETFNGTKEWLADNGYEQCGICKP